MMNIQNRNPDVEVLFEFNGARKNSVADGYSPSHLVKENYLTIGLHKYYENICVVYTYIKNQIVVDFTDKIW